MKKTTGVLSLLVISMLFANLLQASSMVEYVGEYKNEHLYFKATSRRVSCMLRRNRRRVGHYSATVIFRIKSVQGYKILNNTKVIFEGKAYKFNPSQAAGNYYKQGEVSFRGRFSNNSLVKLEYYVCKEGEQTCLRVVKKLKFIFTRRARGSHDRVKVKLVEIGD